MPKSIIGTKEIAHVWISQNRAEANTQNWSQSFNGRSFYSYRREIAAIRFNEAGDRAVFVNDSRCSNGDGADSPTTATHINLLLNACSHCQIFTYESYDNVPAPSSVTSDFLYEFYLQKIGEFKSKAAKAKKYKAENYKQVRRYLKLIEQLVVWFDIPDVSVDYTEIDNLIREAEVQYSEAIAVEEEKQRQKQASLLESDRPAFDAWLVGTANFMPDSWYRYGATRLRVCPDDSELIETSRGASFPRNMCEKLYRIYLQCIEENVVFAAPLRIGNYTLTKIDANGVYVGCHHISPEEIERFAKVLGLEDDE